MIWRRWVEALGRVEPGTSLAIVRIAVGLVVAGDLAETWSSGALALMWGDVSDTAEGFRHFAPKGLWTLIGTHYDAVRAVAAVTIVSALSLAMGLGSRLSAFVALQGCIALFHLNLLSGGGHDRVATNALWLLVLADAGRTLSVACRLRTGRWTDPTPVPAWPRWLMVFQLVVMYTVTGLQKIGPEWFPWGDLLAVHNMLLVPSFARWDLSPYLGALAPLTRAATLVTWVWEVSFFVVGLAMLRGWTRVRSTYAFLGAAFHLTLLAVANLGPFSLISLSLYPALFGPGEWPARVRTGPSYAADPLPPSRSEE